MATCTKSFSLNVGVEPYLWFKMEEAGNNDRIDQINGDHLANTVSVNAACSNPPGKVNRGMQFLSNNLVAGP